MKFNVIFRSTEDENDIVEITKVDGSTSGSAVEVAKWSLAGIKPINPEAEWELLQVVEVRK